jgi:hypothetical protein
VVIFINYDTIANFTVTMTTGFEQVCHEVKVLGCTLQYTLSGQTQRGMVILSGNNPSKSGNNLEFRYRNQSPNGVPKNTTSVPLLPGGLRPMTFGTNGSLMDPNKVSNI